MKPKKTVVLLSGGMDSATLLYQCKAEGQEVRALAFNYGQRHLRELEAAKDLAGALQVQLAIMDLTDLARILPGNALTDKKVNLPIGHYAEDAMKATVVPNRNMIFVSIALAHAISLGYDAVGYAAQTGEAGDGQSLYHDCRPVFVHSLASLATICDEHKVELDCPFLCLTKAQIIHLGNDLKVPFAKTWSCYYAGGDKHCGRCGTCVKRQHGFLAAGLSDSTEYEDKEFAFRAFNIK